MDASAQLLLRGQSAPVTCYTLARVVVALFVYVNIVLWYIVRISCFYEAQFWYSALDTQLAY